MANPVTAVNDCIRWLRGTGGLKVFKRDFSTGVSTVTRAELLRLAEQWSETCGTSPDGAETAPFTLPADLLDLYTGMESNGISFVGRRERALPCKPELADIMAFFPPASSAEPTRANGFHRTGEVCQPQFPLPSARAAYLPVCFCHLNPIEQICPVTLTPADGTSGSSQWATFVLCDREEGLHPVHNFCSSGDGAGLYILLRYNRTRPHSEPEVWGCASLRLIGQGVDDLFECFYIARTIGDYVRLGCARYMWVRGWQLLMGSARLRKAYRLDAVDGVEFKGDLLGTMVPWLQAFGSAKGPLPEPITFTTRVKK